VYRTPALAIIFTSAVTLALALSGTFATLAAGSAISRLFVYAATCAATLELRRGRHAARVKPALFVVPGGPVIPAAGVLVSVAIVAFATPREVVVGLGALVVGAGLYALTRLHYRGGAPPPDDFLGED
jgi:amino acid transporter